MDVAVGSDEPDLAGSCVLIQRCSCRTCTAFICVVEGLRFQQGQGLCKRQHVSPAGTTQQLPLQGPSLLLVCVVPPGFRVRVCLRLWSKADLRWWFGCNQPAYVPSGHAR